MGIWCWEPLSASDGSLRVALGLCNAAQTWGAPGTDLSSPPPGSAARGKRGHAVLSWPEDVQIFTGIHEGARNYAGERPHGELLLSHRTPDAKGMRGTISVGGTTIVCQASPELYTQIWAVINDTHAGMFSSASGFVRVMEYLNSPDEGELAKGYSVRPPSLMAA